VTVVYSAVSSNPAPTYFYGIPAGGSYANTTTYYRSLSTSCMSTSSSTCDDTTITAAGNITQAEFSNALPESNQYTVQLAVNGTPVGATCVALPPDTGGCVIVESPSGVPVSIGDRIEVVLYTAGLGPDELFGFVGAIEANPSTSTTITQLTTPSPHTVTGTVAFNLNLSVVVPFGVGAFSNAYACTVTDTTGSAGTAYSVVTRSLTQVTIYNNNSSIPVTANYVCTGN